MAEATKLAIRLACERPACPCGKTARNGVGNTHCPVHEDRDPSLSVSEKDGNPLVHCKAGCSQQAVIGALGKRGLWPERSDHGDRVKKRTKGKRTRYEVRNPEGHLVAIHVRQDGPDGKKMWWEQPDGSNGLGGMASSVLPLYGSEALPALADGAQVVVTEGEKAAEVLRSLDITAIGTVTGAADTPANDALSPLVRLGVVLWADNDDTGRQHMARIAARLIALGCGLVHLVEWPEAPHKGDAADAVAKGVDLYRLIAAAAVWKPGQVDLASLLDNVAAFYRRFVVLTKEQADTLALWTLHTHAVAAAETTPYINISSAEKESGKTRTGEVAKLLVANPLSAESISAAALARSIDMGITLLLDEVDTIFKKGNGAASESVEMLRGVLDSGWRRGGQYVRIVGQGANMAPYGFSTFGAKMLIGIGDIPGTLGSRSVPIVLRRRRRDTEPVERFRIRKVTPEAEALRSSLAEGAAAYVDQLREAEPVIPDALNDRMADSWEPLIAIADLAGSEWPDRALNAAVTLSGRSVAEDESTGVRLLADLRPFFVGRPRATSEVLEYLNTREESSWGTWNEGKGMSSHNLAKILRPFGIKPRTVRLDKDTRMGYSPTDFEDSFSRYLPSDGGKTVTLSHEANDGDFQPPYEDVVTATSQKGARHGCDGVTDKRPEEAGFAGFRDTDGKGAREVFEL